MVRIAETFEFGDPNTMDFQTLLLKLNRMYLDLAEAVNSKPDLYQRNVNGTPTNGSPSDTFLAQGSININATTSKVEMLTQHVSPTVVTWTTLS